MTDLGKVMLTPKGTYNEGTSYERLDLVEHNGSSYVALKETTGNEPGGGAVKSSGNFMAVDTRVQFLV